MGSSHEPINRRTPEGKIHKFNTLDRRGIEATFDQTFSFNFKPESYQISANIAIYFTNNYYDAEYCDEPDMRLLGNLIIKYEITGSARNELSGSTYRTRFVIEDDDF
jgi:hypothetical protein